MELFLVTVPTIDGTDLATEFYLVEEVDAARAIYVACRECGATSQSSKATAKSIDNLLDKKNVIFITSTAISFEGNRF